MKKPCRRSARASASGRSTTGNSDRFDMSISTTIAITTQPSSTSTTRTGRAIPSMAPPIELADASTASGSVRRRLPSPLRNKVGPADSALASATSSPAPRTKSRWNGKKLPTIGTNSVPPPMPAGTATTPIAKQATNSASGHAHHETAEAAAALSAWAEAAAAIRPSANSTVRRIGISAPSARPWPARR